MTKEDGGAVYEAGTVHVLWHELPVKNTSLKYIGR